LKDLYEEIGFLDRKIAYCQTHETFDSDQARASALQKLMTKRNPLVKAALEMAGRGIQCDPKYLPRSLRESAENAEGAQ
jgi:hypothetical protein